MSQLTQLGGDLFQWVLRSTWQAAVLAGLILAVQWALRRRLSPAWRYGLWLLLVVRLLMPVSPQSAFSIFNLTGATQVHPVATSYGRMVPDVVVNEPVKEVAQGLPAVTESGEAALVVRTSAVAQRKAKVDWFIVAFCGWLAGVCFCGARLVWTNGRFLSRIGGYQPITDERVTRLLDDCRVSFKITRTVRLIESEEVESPAVYGLWRTWLLLPDGIFERFSTPELRCILLHELAHIKRGDLGVNWLVAGLQVLHWFNPVLWLAWGWMRADRELATDALALAHVQESDRVSYGETILKVLEGLTGEPTLPALVGIVESKSQLKERLAAIGRVGKYWKWVALAAAVALGIIGLTDARTEKPKPLQATAINMSRPNQAWPPSKPVEFSPHPLKGGLTSLPSLSSFAAEPTVRIDGVAVGHHTTREGKPSPQLPDQTFYFRLWQSGCMWKIYTTTNTNIDKASAFGVSSCDGTNVFTFGWGIQGVFTLSGKPENFNGMARFEPHPFKELMFEHDPPLWWAYASSCVLCTNGPAPSFLIPYTPFPLRLDIEPVNKAVRRVGPVNATLTALIGSSEETTVAQIEPLLTNESDGILFVTKCRMTGFYMQLRPQSDGKGTNLGPGAPCMTWDITLDKFGVESDPVSFAPQFLPPVASSDAKSDPQTTMKVYVDYNGANGFFGAYVSDHLLSEEEMKAKVHAYPRPDLSLPPEEFTSPPPP